MEITDRQSLSPNTIVKKNVKHSDYDEFSDDGIQRKKAKETSDHEDVEDGRSGFPKLPKKEPRVSFFTTTAQNQQNTNRQEKIPPLPFLAKNLGSPYSTFSKLQHLHTQQ